MNEKQISIIGVIVGFLTFIRGIWIYYSYVRSFVFDYTSVISIFAGIIIVFVSINKMWIFIWEKYKKQIKYSYIIGILIIILFLFLQLFGYFSISILVLYSIIYFELLAILIWLFIYQYVITNKDRVKANTFEFMFFFSLFISTIFITMAVGKMTVLNWLVYDIEVIIYFYILSVWYICAIFSGILHYINEVG